MNRNALKFISVLVIMLFVLIAFSSCKPKYVRGAIDDEAENEGKAFWDKAFSKCGDSYFGKLSSIMVEFKDPFFFTYHKMDGRVFTEADKLNGIEWEGTTSTSSKAYRFYREGKWSEWFDSTPIGLHDKLYLPVRKVKGKWELGKPTDEKFVAVPCEQVPK